jgi:hypothetical protein
MLLAAAEARAVLLVQTAQIVLVLAVAAVTMAAVVEALFGVSHVLQINLPVMVAVALFALFGPALLAPSHLLARVHLNLKKQYEPLY